MSFDRINQAVNEKDWDLVVELANKAKVAEQQQRTSDALADPAKITIVTEGRNGQTVTYEFPVKPSEKAKVNYSYDRSSEFNDFNFYEVRPIRSVERHINISVSIAPKSNW